MIISTSIYRPGNSNLYINANIFPQNIITEHACVLLLLHHSVVGYSRAANTLSFYIEPGSK